MESPWEILETINNGYNFPTGHSIAWCLTDYFPVSNEMKQQHIQHERKCFLQMGKKHYIAICEVPELFKNDKFGYYLDSIWQLQSIF